MSLAPQKSLIWDASPSVIEFRWGAPPEAGIEPGASNKHNSSSVTLSPALIAIFVVLGSAFLIVSYYKIFTRFCKSRRWRPWRWRRRGFESEEVQDISEGGLFLQDSNGWQIYSQSSYGLDEAVIKSIPLCMFRKEEKLVDEVECSVCLVEFKDNEALRILPKCSHAFHINCIDVWLRSHANCPLCRANVVVFNGSENPPWVPAMAGRIRPNLEHGIAGVVHDRFRSDEMHIIDNITNTNNDDYVPELQQDSEFQNIDLELEGSSGNYYDDLGGGENLEESVSGCLNLQPVLSRSYSSGCSSNENLNFSREFITNPEVSLDSLLLTETASSSPWKRAFKRFNSPFSTKGGIFSLRSPFFNRSRNYSHGGSTSNFSSTLMFPLSPARDHHHHHHHQRRNYSHGGAGLTRIRGGSLSPPFMRVNTNQANRAQSMTSPLFMKRSSFSLFTPNRLRSGDPEALLSPDRFKHHENE